MIKSNTRLLDKVLPFKDWIGPAVYIVPFALLYLELDDHIAQIYSESGDFLYYKPSGDWFNIGVNVQIIAVYILFFLIIFLYRRTDYYNHKIFLKGTEGSDPERLVHEMKRGILLFEEINGVYNFLLIGLIIVFIIGIISNIDDFGWGSVNWQRLIREIIVLTVLWTSKVMGKRRIEIISKQISVFSDRKSNKL